MMRRLVSVVSLVLCAAMFCGCAAFRQSVKAQDPDKSKPMSARYDHTDLRSMTDEMAEKVLNAPFMQEENRPLFAVIDVENRTTEHIDTKAMTDSLRRKMLNSGKARFVNAARRDDLLAEQNYAAANATPETRAKIGKQLGAKYIITGSLIEIKSQSGRQVRVSKKKEIFYEFTIEVTDTTTGEIMIAPAVERSRLQSEPLIGW